MSESTQQNNRKRTQPQQQKNAPKKDSTLEIRKFQNKKVRVIFLYNRHVEGVLKGFDALGNLVLDETVELLLDPEDSSKLTGKTRNLGLVVARGPLIRNIATLEGSEYIENPFGASEQDPEE